MTEKQKNILKDTTLAICCLARDCGDRLARNISRLQTLASYCKETQFFIVENDSKDNTRDILTRWHASNNKVHLPDIHAYQREKGVSIDFDRSLDASTDTHTFMKRIQRISLARDCYLDALAKSGFIPNYVVMLDVDVYRFEVDGIINSICAEREWDILTANGRKYEVYTRKSLVKNVYYDSYALEESDEKSPPFVWKIPLQKKYASMKKGDEWIAVSSAFGGLGIYQYHVLFHFLGNEVPFVKNPRIRVSYLSAIANDEHQYCEHISFHRALASMGYTGIYINPSMILYYNTLVRAWGRYFLHVLLKGRG